MPWSKLCKNYTPEFRGGRCIPGLEDDIQEMIVCKGVATFGLEKVAEVSAISRCIWIQSMLSPLWPPGPRPKTCSPIMRSCTKKNDGVLKRAFVSHSLHFWGLRKNLRAYYVCCATMKYLIIMSLSQHMHIVPACHSAVDG